MEPDESTQTPPPASTPGKWRRLGRRVMRWLLWGIGALVLIVAAVVALPAAGIPVGMAVALVIVAMLLMFFGIGA